MRQHQIIPSCSTITWGDIRCGLDRYVPRDGEDRIALISGFGARIGLLCLFEKDSEVATEKTKRLAAACSRAGVEVALHPHVRSSIETT